MSDEMFSGNLISALLKACGIPEHDPRDPFAGWLPIWHENKQSLDDAICFYYLTPNPEWEEARKRFQGDHRYV